MADTNKTPPDKADTLVLPSRDNATRPLGSDPIFQEVWEEKRGPVKSLGEAGLTKGVFVYQDRNGVMRTEISLLGHDACEAVVALLHEEQLG